mgnify:CR=1 FL=1
MVGYKALNTITKITAPIHARARNAGAVGV